MEVRRSEVRFYNQLMIDGLLKQFGMAEYKPLAIPIPAELNLNCVGVDFLSNSILYKQLFGVSIHLANMERPYIPYSVQYFASFTHSPTELLWRAEEHIRSYLEGKRTLGTRYCYRERCIVVDFPTQNGGKKPDPKSISGY